MRRPKEYENMSLEELKASASYPRFMKEFMNTNLYKNKTPIIIQNGIQINIYDDYVDIIYVLNHKAVGILIKVNQTEIHVIAVHPDYRRRDIAKDLIGEAIKHGATSFKGSISPLLVSLVWAFYHEKWRFE